MQQRQPKREVDGRIDALMQAHFEAVRRFLRRRALTPDDVDEAAQRVFITAWRRLGEVRVGAERAFLLAVAVREAGHIRRSHRRRPEDFDSALLDGAFHLECPFVALARKQDVSRLSAALSRMPTALRIPFQLAELDGYSVREVAELLAIPLGTAKTRVRRARAQLKGQGSAKAAARREAERVRPTAP